MSKEKQLIDSINWGDLKTTKKPLKDKTIDPSYDINFPLVVSITRNDVNVVELLIKDKRVIPSDRGNWAISLASEKNYFDIVKLLWKDNLVKNTLQQDNNELYQILITKDVKKKADNF